MKNEKEKYLIALHYIESKLNLLSKNDTEKMTNEFILGYIAGQYRIINDLLELFQSYDNQTRQERIRGKQNVTR